MQIRLIYLTKSGRIRPGRKHAIIYVQITTTIFFRTWISFYIF